METVAEKTADEGSAAAAATANSSRKNGPLATWRRLVSYMFEPEDGECLAALRIAFGLLMMIDTMDERGFCRADKRWMEPNRCYFPLFDFIRPLPGRWMCLAYAFMFSGLLGIFAGYHYRISCAMYAVPYWYIFLADKSSWNNHSYLFGLLTVIFSVTEAHRNWSLDNWLSRRIASDSSSASLQVPRWNYLLLRIQFFIMYFVAGLKKFEPDWLFGYSMTSLGHHYVFAPFRYVFSAEFVDHWIVHVGGFLIDLLSGFGLSFRSTRPFTIIVLLAFHGLNSMMFTIGMFPYVCAAMIPVFCEPRAVSTILRTAVGWGRAGDKSKKGSPPPPPPVRVPSSAERRNVIAACICAYTALQLFLPYSHFVTQGYNGWRNGLYGYSWDMMVYNIDVAKIQVKVVDHARREQFFLDPHVWTDNSKWVLHGDMLFQFADCVAANMPNRRDNMSVRMDIWGSLNGRFHQRLVDPNEDLLHTTWSPWSPVPWLMPLLRHLDLWRPWIEDAKNRTSNDDVLFFADFPGMTVANDFLDGRNGTADGGTLAVLEGAVAVWDSRDGDEPVRLVSGEAIDVSGRLAVTTVSATPSCYVYAAAAASDGTTAADGDGTTAADGDGTTAADGGGTTAADGDGTTAADGGGGGCAADGSRRPRTPRAGRCSDACYAFAFDAVMSALSALR